MADNHLPNLAGMVSQMFASEYMQSLDAELSKTPEPQANLAVQDPHLYQKLKLFESLYHTSIRYAKVAKKLTRVEKIKPYESRLVDILESAILLGMDQNDLMILDDYGEPINSRIFVEYMCKRFKVGPYGDLTDF